MLYFGPETILPLSSAAAAIAGVVILFWQRLVGYMRRVMAGLRSLLMGLRDLIWRDPR